MAMKFDAKKEVTNRLKFKPNPELNNLCLGYLESVEVVMNEIAKINDKGQESTWEYAGHTIPRLVFTFRNYVRKNDLDKADRFYIHTENVIGAVKSSGDKIEQATLQSIYESMWARIKHIHDAFVSDPNYAPFKLLPEIDEYGKTADRVEQFTQFFNVIADAFNKGKDGLPIYKGANDSKLPCYMKLVAEYKQRKWLELPTFVGEGFIERYKEGVPPTIELKPSDTVELAAGKGAIKASSASSDDIDNLPPEIREALGRG